MTRINGMVEAAQRAAEAELHERQCLEAMRLGVAAQVFAGLVVDVIGPQVKPVDGTTEVRVSCNFDGLARIASKAAVEFMVANGKMKVVDRQQPDAG